MRRQPDATNVSTQNHDVVIPLPVTAQLTEHDIHDWMTACENAGTLRQLARYANFRAASIENQPNDAGQPQEET